MLSPRFAIVLIAVAGCFDPQVQSGRLLCSTENSCPSGFDCIAGRCWTHGAGPDLASSAGDMTLPPLMTTPHQLDIGQVPAGTRVQLQHVVVTGVELANNHPADLTCIYIAYVQDPNGTAPDGIQLRQSVKSCVPVDGGDCVCPARSNSPLDRVANLGDHLTIVGTFVVDGMTTPPTHIVNALESVTLTTGTQTVTPVQLTDATLFAAGANGFVMYENMLVTLAPPAGITVAPIDASGDFSGAGVSFFGAYAASWSAGGSFPANGQHFTSITGIVGPARNAIIPRVRADFVP